LLKKIKKKLLISLAAAGLLYLAFTIYADFSEVASAFNQFNWMLLPLLLLLSLLNYFTRFLKWDYYLGIVKIKIKKLDSLSIFLSGLIMSVTPGKMGELLKAYLVKEVSGEPVSKTAPIIFVERITDFVSLMIIAIIGAYVFNFGRIIVLAVAAFFALVIIIIGSRKIALKLLSILEKIKFLKTHVESIHNAYESSYQMLRPVPLFYMSLLSLVSWFFECLGYHLILINFDVELGLLWGSFSYAFATIVGAISMLPGGLGVTEGSLTFMLVQEGYAKDISVASTFIIRAVTLWFAVLVGIISVSIYQNRFGKITIDSVSTK
jgi:glycosyltransferase 2 family protein